MILICAIRSIICISSDHVFNHYHKFHKYLTCGSKCFSDYIPSPRGFVKVKGLRLLTGRLIKSQKKMISWQVGPESTEFLFLQCYIVFALLVSILWWVMGLPRDLATLHSKRPTCKVCFATLRTVCYDKHNKSEYHNELNLIVGDKLSFIVISYH